jgi:Domain of Unknown Function (DUF928)
MNEIQRAFTLAWVVVSLLGVSTPTIAQPHPDTHHSDLIPIDFQQQPDGSSRGRPGDRVGTGSRGECLARSLTALVPENEWGNMALAIEAYPTFWFYAPCTPEQTPVAEFVLRDEEGEVYRSRFPLPATPGVVSVSLPPATPLETNKDYHWYFQLYSPAQDSSPVDYVHGWVKRVARPDLEPQLNAATPRERIALYAQQGIWHTALTDLANLRLAEPQDDTLVRDWVDLLADVGLQDLAEEAIVTMPFEQNP